MRRVCWFRGRCPGLRDMHIRRESRCESIYWLDQRSSLQTSLCTKLFIYLTDHRGTCELIAYVTLRTTNLGPTIQEASGLNVERTYPPITRCVECKSTLP